MAQLVEHHLAKVRVAGSNPVVRSNKHQVSGHFWAAGPRAPLARRYTISLYCRVFRPGITLGRAGENGRKSDISKTVGWSGQGRRAGLAGLGERWVFPIRPGVWRVDIELHRDKVTGRRRRVSRYVEGARSDAEVASSRLRVADKEKRLPTGGTSARSALDLYLNAADTGLIDLAPRTILTTRSAANTLV